MRVAAINTAYGRSIKQLSTHFQFKIADRKRAIMSNKKKRSFNENENFLNYDAFKTSLIYRHTRTRLYMQITLSLKIKEVIERHNGNWLTLDIKARNDGEFVGVLISFYTQPR